MLDERLSAQLHHDHGMSHREYEVLVRLDGAGGRLRMSQLAGQMVASQPLISQTIGRLEKRRWVRREASTSDKRGIDAIITAVGSQALAEASKPHADLIRSLLLSLMDKADLVPFTRAIGIVADHLRTHRLGGVCNLPSCPLVEE
ncbi:MAG: MarR family transcriptional regulator [Acidimicrobiales bacterium]|nr:MarR family transcriptional regulator [Acidimicrobiales bacterium]